MARLDYHRRGEVAGGEKSRLLKEIAEKLEAIDEIVFAYVHGGFIERRSFRDVDVAIWIADPKRSFHYTVDFSAKLEVELGIPIDIQVLNEAPLPFKHNVFTCGKLLLSKNEGLRLQMADRVIRQYLDLKSHVNWSRP